MDDVSSWFQILELSGWIWCEFNTSKFREWLLKTGNPNAFSQSFIWGVPCNNRNECHYSYLCCRKSCSLRTKSILLLAGRIDTRNSWKQTSPLDSGKMKTRRLHLKSFIAIYKRWSWFFFFFKSKHSFSEFLIPDKPSCKAELC